MVMLRMSAKEACALLHALALAENHWETSAIHRADLPAIRERLEKEVG